jgi:hypothetical protein
MTFLNRAGRFGITITALILAVMVMSGCSGFKPTELRNNREEGPEKGLFSGSQGEFVISRDKSSTKGDKTKLEGASNEQ